METLTISPKFQVVIPKKVREAAQLEIGDFLTAELKPDGILLKPAIVVERDFKAELEQHLKEAEADLKTGRVLGPFANARDALRALKAFAKKRTHAGTHHRKVRRAAR